MGFKTSRKTGSWRWIGQSGRIRVLLLAVFLLMMLVPAVMYTGGGPVGLIFPSFLAQSDSAGEVPESAPMSQRAPLTARSSQATDRVSPANRESATSLAVEETSRADASRIADRQGESDTDEGAPIHGSVLDDAGQPLPDMTVTAEPLGSSAGRPSQAGRAQTVTDHLGMFSFDALPGDEYLLRVAENEAFHPGRLTVRVGASAAEIYLQRKGSIQVAGRVSDESDMPLADVQIRSLGSREVSVTDPGGEYRIELERVKAGTAPVLEFRHADYRDVRERVLAENGQGSAPVRLDVVMPGRRDTVSVSGWVSGPGSEPIAGAAVWLASSSPAANHRTRTDSLGGYEISDVERGDHYRLGVEPGGSEYQRYVSEPRSIGSAPVSHDVRLEKAGEAELSGVLVDPRGNSLPGFGIWLRQLEAGAPAPIFLQADARGHFAPVEVQSGALRLETQSSPHLVADGITLAAGESRHLQIPLDWGGNWLLGQIVDDEDQPVQRAQVVLQWRSEEPGVVSSSRRAVRSDQGGFFSIANLGATFYQLTVSAPGFQTRRMRVSPGQGEEILIPMTRLADDAGGQR